MPESPSNKAGPVMGTHSWHHPEPGSPVLQAVLVLPESPHHLPRWSSQVCVPPLLRSIVEFSCGFMWKLLVECDEPQDLLVSAGSLCPSGL